VTTSTGAELVETNFLSTSVSESQGTLINRLAILFLYIVLPFTINTCGLSESLHSLFKTKYSALKRASSLEEQGIALVRLDNPLSLFARAVAHHAPFWK